MRDSSFVQRTGSELLISLRSVNAFNHNYVEDRQIKFQTLEVKKPSNEDHPSWPAIVDTSLTMTASPLSSIDFYSQR